MCSIAGFLNCGDSILLERINATMRHRGPDASGVQYLSFHLNLTTFVPGAQRKSPPPSG
jgi:asparagine synthetase B (glutamine-hydrolysing)